MKLNPLLGIIGIPFDFLIILKCKKIYDKIKIPGGLDIFSIKPTKDIKRGANTIYVLNTLHC